MAWLSVDNLQFSYDHSTVLKDISFSIEPGEFVGLVGPNGSGKTTLLRCIARTLGIKKGEIKLKNRNVKGYSTLELARNIAVVPQGGAVEFSFSVHDIVMMGRHPHLSRFSFETEDDLKVVDESLRATKTIEFKNRKVQTLSGGEFQRVLIARALAQEPRLLLLDEPTSHLDINHQLEIMDIMAELNKSRNITILGVFHDLNLAARYCRRLLLLHKGRLVADGPLDEILTRSNLRKVFNINAIIRRNPVTRSLFVDPITTLGSVEDPGEEGYKNITTDETRASSTKKFKRRGLHKIHLVCGGGTGSELMRRLSDDGYEITTGVLNVLDQDHRTASAQNIGMVSEAAFSPISDKSHDLNLHLIKKADVVILTDVPFGTANLLNLEAVRYAMNVKKKIYLYEPRRSSSIKNRDFTGGKADKIYAEIMEYARRIKTYGELNLKLRS